ncbi:MAG: argininosuccinate lyase [Patescibacteria group bacterium]|nr:argininosuccinate lyase [Patescibacteria group bacterium]
MKLWENNNNHHEDNEIERFTAGEDVSLDQLLVKYDVIGSIAHAVMLQKIGILTQPELMDLKRALLEIIELDKKGQFKIETWEEDVHTKIENYLTLRLGESGKKIHTGRSRNDQILVDLRLYTKEKLLKIQKNLLNLCNNLIVFSKKNKSLPMPGYTHLQKAMPSSVDLWALSFAESLLDDLIFTKSVYNLNDQNPLGSGAGYGSPINLDRELTTNLLGFKRLQNNVLYVQNSRGKIESMVLAALSQIMLDLAKLSNDLILFSTEEFGFFEIPEEFKTGSSMMPRKRNPDVLELTRARASKVLSYYFQTINIIKDLPSGYNRDLQETKEPILKGLTITNSCLEMMVSIINNLKANKQRLESAFSPEIYAADKTFELVNQGIPFRDAYREIERNLEKVELTSPEDIIKSRKSKGTSGDLGLDESEKRIKEELSSLNSEKEKFYQKINSLVS